MSSHSSWDDVAARINYGKMSGARALLTGALKDKMGFQGFVVSDWNAIGQLPGCTNASCPQAINAGIDMVMVPDDWQAFIANTTRQVEDGEIPMARIDDAVSRIKAGADKSGVDLSHVDVPFGVLASPPFSAAFADVKIIAGTTAGRADLPCASLDAP